nr:RNA-directed DNA polymerase, eukaryota [Tanacetum cinerariifolium]
PWISLIELSRSSRTSDQALDPESADQASKLSHPGLDVSFRRLPRGGVEIQQYEHMKEKVKGCILADMMDRWFWALEGSGKFTIAYVRTMIDDFMLP